MGGTGGEMGSQTFLNLIRRAPEHHRIDESVGTAVAQVRFGEAYPQPIVAIIVQRHVSRQFLPSQSTGLGRIGFQRHLLFDRAPLSWAEDFRRLSSVFRSGIV